MKLANENRVVGVQLLLKNLGIEETSDKTLLRMVSQNNDEKYNVCVLIIPGIEGVANTSWMNIASALALPTFMLQYFDSPNENALQAKSKEIVDLVRSTIFKKTEFFYLVGYSFGTFVTFDIARALEEDGQKGHVMLIDGAPNFLKHLSAGHLASTETFSDEAIQLMMIAVVLSNVLKVGPHEAIGAAMRECKTWEEKVDRLIQQGVKHNLKYSVEYMRNMMNSMYTRLRFVLNNGGEAVEKIQSSITLVRPTEVAVVDIDEDYELSKFTDGSVQLRFVEGNHTTMLDNAQLAQIITEADPNLESDRSFEAYVWSGKNT